MRFWISLSLLATLLVSSALQVSAAQAATSTVTLAVSGMT
jgi:hypothetical protein